MKFKYRNNILFFSGIICVLVFTLSPPVWLFITSLKHPVEIFSDIPTFIPSNPTVSNYIDVIRGYSPSRGIRFPMSQLFSNSVFVALLSSFISVFVATFAAYSIARSRSKIMFLLFMIIMIMRTIPRISVAIPLYEFFQKLGLLDSIIGLSLTHITVSLPLATFLMYSFFQDLPIELEEAAQVDGTGPVGSFFRITIPLSTPGISVAAIISFIYSYNEFLYSIIMVSTKARTLPVGLSVFIQEYGIVWELLSAAGTLAIIPTVVFAFFVQKHIVRGLTMGAIKG
jgi:multiple sugar transport system permease protein